MDSLSLTQVKYLRSLAQKKHREANGEFLLEGQRLCEEALSSALELNQIVVDHEHLNDPLVQNATARKIPVFLATKRQFSQFCDSQTPQGIAIIAKLPRAQSLPTVESDKLVLALDRLADPGNMGTLFRTARWFGVNHILLSRDCVDPFSPKVVRSSMGALGNIQIHEKVDLVNFATRWQEQNGQSVILTMHGEPLESYQPTLGKGVLLILGSEAHGVDPQLEMLGKLVTIKSRGTGESLNAAVAGGIALWALTRVLGT